MNTSLLQNTQIRKMLATDLERVIVIEREIFLFPWSMENFADSINAGYDCRVLEETNALFGYGVMMAGPDEAHLLTIGIAANWQSKGWGKKLLYYFIHLARQKNLLSMLLDVRESNTGAALLYKQIGFQPIGKRKGYYPAMCGREDAIVMKLLL
ncbi:MAG: ribosomal protein S18-alanine N-acetyltransferase [Nitrosomonas sp.]|nr:ribosomal protein S18-alanine N-acetyltransferase [Nitrosomonas sp.]